MGSPTADLTVTYRHTRTLVCTGCGARVGLAVQWSRGPIGDAGGQRRIAVTLCPECVQRAACCRAAAPPPPERDEGAVRALLDEALHLAATGGPIPPEIDAVLAALDRHGPDAIRAMVADGLRDGLTVYGPLDVATDPRDLDAEADKELRDALIYRLAAWLRRRRAGGGQP